MPPEGTAWGPSRRWSYGLYELSYYSRGRRARNRWEFSTAGSGASARTPWGAILRARRKR